MTGEEITRFTMMKPLLHRIALPLFAISTIHGQQPAEAILIRDEGDGERVWVTEATADSIRYQETEQAADSKDLKTDGIRSIYLLDPPALSAAIEHYQARRYSEAKDQLAAVKTAFKAIGKLPDNPSTRAAFLELECLRKTGDLDGLAKALEAFDKGGLTRESQLRQVELYGMWDAVRAKDWDRLEQLCKERLEERMPGFQRAQVGYCLGLALDSQDKIVPAINAYNIALTADTGASEDITRNSALNALRLYMKDPEVRAAINRWGTPDDVLNSPGRQRLLEAGALAGLYELTLGGDTPLAAEFKDLLKYAAKTEPAAAPVGKMKSGPRQETESRKAGKQDK